MYVLDVKTLQTKFTSCLPTWLPSLNPFRKLRVAYPNVLEFAFSGHIFDVKRIRSKFTKTCNGSSTWVLTWMFHMKAHVKLKAFDWLIPYGLTNLHKLHAAMSTKCSHIEKCASVYFDWIKICFLNRLGGFFLKVFPFLFPKSTRLLLFHDFPWCTLKFHDFPGLENEIIKFHDFPGFPWPVRTLISAEIGRKCPKQCNNTTSLG